MRTNTSRNDSTTVRISVGSIIVVERRTFGERKISTIAATAASSPSAERSEKSSSCSSGEPCARWKALSPRNTAITAQQTTPISREIGVFVCVPSRMALSCSQRA